MLSGGRIHRRHRDGTEVRGDIATSVQHPTVQTTGFESSQSQIQSYHVNVSKLKALFGDDVPFMKMMVTKEGLYSVTRAHERKQIIAIMQETLPRPLGTYTIVDGTAGNGGDLISFSKHFRHVTGIEYNADNFKVCVHNMRMINAKNVTLKNVDTLVEVASMNEDVFFLDPPKGGRDYVSQSCVDLKLGQTSVGTLLTSIKLQSDITSDLKPDYFFVKVPVNANMSDFLPHIVHEVYNWANEIAFYIVSGFLKDPKTLVDDVVEDEAVGFMSGARVEVPVEVHDDKVGSLVTSALVTKGLSGISQIRPSAGFTLPSLTGSSIEPLISSPLKEIGIDPQGVLSVGSIPGLPPFMMSSVAQPFIPSIGLPPTTFTLAPLEPFIVS